MKILLDTCVLSEIRHPSGNKSVKDAVAKHSDNSLYLSVITIGEISKGIALLQAGKKRDALITWLDGLQTEFDERILPVETETARLWGKLTADLQQTGILLPALEGLLAATAIHYQMHLMTRNTRHFKSSGAVIIDPWQG